MTHALPDLGYDYNALEPYIDEETMKIHHDKHHQGYTNKLNAALEKHPDLQEKSAEDLLKNLNSLPEESRQAIINNGGGYVNHSLFWQILSKDKKCEGEIAKQIERDFGSFDEFKKQFSDAASTQFGSGWAWLIYNPEEKKLQITKTQNQDTPLSQGLIPILAIDVWEHAYYLKYQNKRPEYIENFFNVINWEKVDELLKKAK